MKIKRRPTPAPHIPFISLADIAWQVIIFFFMASSFTKNEAVKVDVPSSSPTQQAAADAKTITVQATDTALVLDGQAVALDRLADELAAKLKGKTADQDRAVVVEGRDDLTFQRDVEIMYAIQKAGGVVIMSDEK